MMIYVCENQWPFCISLSLFFFFYCLYPQQLSTSFGLIITWDGKRSARIEIPFEYWNATCGLCGVFDGEPDNDFRTPDGGLVSLDFFSFYYYFLILPVYSFRGYHLFSHEAQGWNVPYSFTVVGVSLLMCFEHHISNERELF